MKRRARNGPGGRLCGPDARAVLVRCDRRLRAAQSGTSGPDLTESLDETPISALCADVPSEQAVFHEVLVLHATDLGWLCRIGEAQVFLAKLDVETRPMPDEGAYGTVIIAPFAVERVRKLLRRK